MNFDPSKPPNNIPEDAGLFALPEPEPRFDYDWEGETRRGQQERIRRLDADSAPDPFAELEHDARRSAARHVTRPGQVFMPNGAPLPQIKSQYEDDDPEPLTSDFLEALFGAEDLRSGGVPSVAALLSEPALGESYRSLTKAARLLDDAEGRRRSALRTFLKRRVVEGDSLEDVIAFAGGACSRTAETLRCVVREGL